MQDTLATYPITCLHIRSIFQLTILLHLSPECSCQFFYTHYSVLSKCLLSNFCKKHTQGSTIFMFSSTSLPYCQKYMSKTPMWEQLGRQVEGACSSDECNSRISLSTYDEWHHNQELTLRCAKPLRSQDYYSSLF